MSKKILSPIPLKFHFSNPRAIRISNFEFHQNLRKFCFGKSKGGTLLCQKSFDKNGFWRVKGSVRVAVKARIALKTSNNPF